MKYNDFVENLADDLQEAFERRGRKIGVEITEVIKPWGKELGLAFSDGGNVNPILYPKQQYEYHEAGMNYLIILNEMMKEIERALKEAPSRVEFDPRTLKDSITIQLINTERSKNYLRDKVHREVEDLSIIYRLNAEVAGGNSGSCVITNSMMKMMGINETDLHELAMEKAPLNRLCTIKSLTDTIEDFISKEFDEIPQIPIMVVTNEEGCFGASAIFYPGIMDRCAEVMNGDFYILPSSQHEVLLYSDNSSFCLQELEAIVREVNDTVLDPSEFLSNNVYHYDHRDKVFELAEKYVERTSEKENLSVLAALYGKQNDTIRNSPSKRIQDIGSRKIQGISL